MGVNLYTSRLVLEALGVDNYGIYNVVGGIVALFSIVNGALASGSSRFLMFELGQRHVERLKKTFSASFVIHSLIALVVLVLAETVGLWFVNTQLVIPPDRLYAANWVYQFSILSCLVSLTQVPYNALIIAHEKMSIYAYIGIYEVLARLLLVFSLFYFTFSDVLIIYGAIVCICSVSVMFFYRWYCVRHFPESHLEVVKDRSYYRSMLSFSMWDVIGHFCVTGNNQGVNVLMNLFFGVAVNAARGITMQVDSAISQFARNFMQAVQPQLVKLFAENNIQKMIYLVFESSRYAYFLLFIVSFPVILETDYILHLWLKEVPAYAPLFLRCTLLVSLIRAFAIPVVQSVHASGHIRRLNLYSGGASVLLTIPLVYVAYKLGFPPQYAYFILIFLSIVWNYLELFILKYEVELQVFRYTVQVYFKSLLVSCMAAVPVWAVYAHMPSSFLRLTVVVLLNTVLVCTFIFFFLMERSTRKKLLTTLKGYIK